jgi:opacity protein-like surface antigen
MKRISMAMVAAAGLCVAMAPSVRAQGSLRYGVNLGLLMPMSNYNDVDKLGWVAGAGATYWLPGNIGVRVDGSYSQTSHKDVNGSAVDGNTKIAGGMASLVYALQPASAPARVFITAGLGMYNVKQDIGGISGSATKVGFGGGAGVALKLGPSPMRLVLATRYTSVATDNNSTQFLPITVGLSFGK